MLAENLIHLGFKGETDHQVITHCQQGGTAGLALSLLRVKGVDVASSECQELSRLATQSSLLSEFKDKHYRGVLLKLEEHGIRAMVLKGRAFAYTIYETPNHRISSDLDLWIHLEDIEKVTGILESLGYEHIPKTCGIYIPSECSYQLPGNLRSVLIDLHWGVTSAHCVARAFDFDDEWIQGTPLKPLGFAGRGMCIGSALLLALCHYALHIPGTRRHVWLYDIHLMLQRITPGQAQQFVNRVIETQHSQVCVDVLNLLRTYFNEPAATLKAFKELREHAASSPPQLLVRCLDSKRSALGDLYREWRSYPKLSQRVFMVFKHLVLPRDSIRWMFPDKSLISGYLHYGLQKAKDRLFRRRT